MSSWKDAVIRATRGLREEKRLYLSAITSLSVAFLFVAAALLVDANLRNVAERWGQESRMSIYLETDAEAGDVAQLTAVLEALPETLSVEHVSSEAARRSFLEDASMASDFADLPSEAFPASVEITLSSATDSDRSAEIASRVGAFRAVTDVETYQGFFDKLQSLMAAGRGFTLFLALLVGLCVFVVISGTIRLALSRRRDEIEVLKLCGATDTFVRRPFVLEGAFQGLAAAGVAVGVLALVFALVRRDLNGSLAAVSGVEASFVHPIALLALLVAASFIGAVGSALSLRRYLSV